jgi:hypothetical protein
MQTPAAAPTAAAADRPPDRYIVRPAGVLAELLGGAAELGEDELMLRLRKLGLITYPSPLLGGLLELSEVLAAEVLAQLDPTDLVLLGQAGRACRAAVLAFAVPQEEEEEEEEDEEEEDEEEDEEEEEESTSDEGSEGGPQASVEVQDRGFCRVCRAAILGQGAGVCVERACLCARRSGRAPGGAEVGMGAPLPELVCVCVRR